jgi:hypothetical protein
MHLRKHHKKNREYQRTIYSYAEKHVSPRTAIVTTEIGVPTSKVRTEFRILLFHNVHAQIVSLYCDPTEVGLLCTIAPPQECNYSWHTLKKERECRLFIIKHCRDIESTVVQKELPSASDLLTAWMEAILHRCEPILQYKEVIPANAVCHYSYNRRRIPFVDHAAVRKQQEIL